MSDPLSLERMIEAKKTLKAMIDESYSEVLSPSGFTTLFPGARGGVGYGIPDVWSLFVETKRNMNAFVQWKHGEAAFLRMLEED